MFEWKDEYSCNIKEVDDQHKKLFSLISELYDYVNADSAHDYYDEIIHVINELRDYTVYHFDNEEKLMEKYEYDSFSLKIHKNQHKMFVKKISSIKPDDIDLNQKKVIIDLIYFIADWIENHILKVDTLYKSYLNSKGVY